MPGRGKNEKSSLSMFTWSPAAAKRDATGCANTGSWSFTTRARVRIAEQRGDVPREATPSFNIGRQPEGRCGASTRGSEGQGWITVTLRNRALEIGFQEVGVADPLLFPSHPTWRSLIHPPASS